MGNDLDIVVFMLALVIFGGLAAYIAFKIFSSLGGWWRRYVYRQ